MGRKTWDNERHGVEKKPKRANVNFAVNETYRQKIIIMNKLLKKRGSYTNTYIIERKKIAWRTQKKERKPYRLTL